MASPLSFSSHSLPLSPSILRSTSFPYLRGRALGPLILPGHSLIQLRSSSYTALLAKKGGGDKGGGDKVGPPDRLISAACYLYPFLDGIQFGKYVITQFPAFQVLLQPLVPAIRLFRGFPLNGVLIFFTLYFAVVRNPGSFSRFVRFNTMQAIVLDVLLIFPELLERSFSPRGGVGLDFVMSLDSTVFLFLLVSLIYGSSSCLFGQLPRLPIVADAADRQVM